MAGAYRIDTMRARFVLFLSLSCTSALAPIVACSSDPPAKNKLPVVDDKPGSKSDAKSPRPDEDGATTLEDGGSKGPGRVYANTSDTLYVYEPVGKALTQIGAFSFDPADKAGAIIDVAVDGAGNMYGTTFTDFFRIDSATARCTWIASKSTGLDYPNALSFVPAGTVDPTKEALVGYATTTSSGDATFYVQIDTNTGEMVAIGDLNASASGPQYRTSGDFVSLVQDESRAYATVKLVQDGAIGTDLLAEVDPTDGHLKRVIGDTKQNDIWGLGYWAGKGYGFASTGRVLEIDMTNGSSTVLLTLDGGAAQPWYGAGVSTQAPTH
jgi:hypothetical protein